MFESLSSRLDRIFQQMRRRGKLSAEDVDSTLKEVRLALLEADVNYGVAKELTNRIRERAIGVEIARALNPAQQVIKIVHEELIQTLGNPVRLDLNGPKPRTITLVGLQGSGKTTVAGKLAKKLRSQGERVMLVAADTYRPAAIQQLKVLGSQIGVDVFFESSEHPMTIIKHAMNQATKGGFSCIVIDTAGRSQLDQELMQELSSIEKTTLAGECLLVLDAMTGQEAINIAEGFGKAIHLTGLILTKMDGDSRGGAAISVRSITGIPIKFLGTGENLDALETFDPARLASRIMGMGDILGLIEKAESAYDQKESIEQAAKLSKGNFTLEDFQSQLKQLRKMGPLHQMLEMIPGRLKPNNNALDSGLAERQLLITEAIINSMTVVERKSPDILNASRRRRIAKGSGMDVQDVNRVIKQFRDAQKLMKSIQNNGGKNLNRLFG